MRTSQNDRIHSMPIRKRKQIFEIFAHDETRNICFGPAFLDEWHKQRASQPVNMCIRLNCLNGARISLAGDGCTRTDNADALCFGYFNRHP